MPMGLSTVLQILAYSHTDMGTIVTQGTPMAAAVNGAPDTASAAPIGSSGSKLIRRLQASALATSIHLGDSGSPQRD